jgi:cytosine/adenosine deaminase-related metal-dependent hydrolase
MDGRRRELRDGAIYAENGIIRHVGPTAELPASADTVIELHGQIVLPGFVNTHHHLNQTLTRNFPGAQNNNLFPWLKALYRAWARVDAAASRASTLIGLAELVQSGCTTVFDHSYVFKNGNSIDCQIEAARNLGVRFHASRGSMSLGESKGGLPPDDCVEDEEFILSDSQRVIERHHDPSVGAMTRIVLAPCSPFSVTPDLLKESARMARHYKVRLHTHLCETLDEERYTLERFQLRPVDWMETLGWLGDDVSFAHAIHVDDDDIRKLAATGCGVAHCPCSNMRLGSGIAPVKAFMAAGVAVGLGVDGSASNDSSNILMEARQAMLVARLQLGLLPPAGPRKHMLLSPSHPMRAGEWMTAREALELATVGGARVLGRDDIGSLEPGKCADFFSLDLGTVGYAGALHDPVAAVLFCAPQAARHTVIHGRQVVRDGEIATVDMRPVIAAHNRCAAKLLEG